MKRIVFPALAFALAIVAPTRNPVISAAPPVHEVQVVAKKYTYEPATIEVTAGEAVRLVIHSDDTTHGFAIKKMKVNLVVPKGGQAVTAEFTAPAPGRYEIACSEFCGLGHHGMKAALVSVAR
ncbi:MAG: cupredoxin domain-containing protein [Acidobacteriota bacterium]